VKRILCNIAVLAAVALAGILACERPAEVDRQAVQTGESIEIMAQGERLQKEGNYRQALEQYQRAISIMPRPALYYNAGACCYALGQYEQAHDYLTRAVNLANDYPAAQYLLSKVRVQLALARQGGAIPATAQATPAPTPRQVAMASATPPRVVPNPATATPPANLTAATPAPNPRRTPVVTPVRTAVAAPAPTPFVTPRPRPTAAPAPTPRPARTPKLDPVANLAHKLMGTAPAPEAPSDSVGPEPTPLVMQPSAQPTPIRLAPLPAPGGPTGVTASSPTPDAFPEPPLVTTPLPSVEPIPTPVPRAAVVDVTPRPTSPGDLPPPISAAELLASGNSRDIESTSGVTTTELTLGQPEFHMQQALSFRQRKMNEAALEELLLVLGASPRHLDARLELADTYDALNRGERALEEYQMAMVDFPSDPKVYFRTGNYYLRHAMKGENPAYFDNASRAYYKALKLDPRYYFAYHNLGLIHMQLGQYDAARKAFEIALKYNPQYPSAHRHLGLLYDQYLKDPKSALYHYSVYLRSNPPDAEEIREWVRALEKAQ
jgi:tetratricopeptide (TPR) repeat protein